MPSTLIHRDDAVYTPLPTLGPPQPRRLNGLRTLIRAILPTPGTESCPYYCPEWGALCDQQTRFPDVMAQDKPMLYTLFPEV